MDMSKLSWMLVGLMPLVAVAADGTWETLSFAKGTYAPLDAYTRAGGKLVGALRPAALFALLAVCTAYLVDGSFNPFLYFRF